MGFDLSYMGTKRQFAPAVIDVVCSAQEGIVLDAFSGMCTVGASIGHRRQVWNNDVLLFPSIVAGALFTSQHLAPTVINAADLLFNDFTINLEALKRRFKEHLHDERECLESESIRRLTNYLRKFAGEYSSAARLKEIRKLANKRKSLPYRLFTITYSDSYFGLEQSLEIDSIVYAVDRNFERGTISEDERSWLLIALGSAMLRVANTTGHFAQYLEPKTRNLIRYLKQRRKRVWAQYLQSLSDLSPVGTFSWRRRNRVFNRDCLELLPSLRRTTQRPSVVYADPPYTDDQYSRYYHVLDTLIRYDYPQVSGKGRYPAGRFQTPFSQKTKVKSAFDSLIGHAASLPADLVLSYPDNGLLYEIGETPDGLLRKHYNKVEISREIRHEHSTFGASKGTVRAPVTEIVYWARP